MKPHEERVIEEKKELDVKLEKLFAFINTADSGYEDLDCENKALLAEQVYSMRNYRSTLSKRIVLFQHPKPDVQIELLPCPFCGSGNIRGILEPAAADYVSLRIVCRTCHAYGPICEKQIDPSTKWNKRYHVA